MDEPWKAFVLGAIGVSLVWVFILAMYFWSCGMIGFARSVGDFRPRYKKGDRVRVNADGRWMSRCGVISAVLDTEYEVTLDICKTEIWFDECELERA